MNYSKITSKEAWDSKDITDEVCQAERTAESIRKQRGLPSGTLVPVMIVCNCSRCRPKYTL